MKKMIAFFIFSTLLMASCTSAVEEATADIDVLVTTAVAQANMSSTANAPTSTPEPTNTPLPTDTPIPIFTASPEPSPLVFSGNGNAVVDVEKWSGPAIAVASYKGEDNFIVRNYDANNNELGIVFNGLYDYQGTVLLDEYDDEHTSRLQVNTTGEWEIEIKPYTFSFITVIYPPTTYEGRDDDVIALKVSDEDDVDLIKYQVPSDDNFIVSATYINQEKGFTRNLVVNVIGPTSGSSILQHDTFLLEVQAYGDWSIEITTK